MAFFLYFCRDIFYPRNSLLPKVRNYNGGGGGGGGGGRGEGGGVLELECECDNFECDIPRR